MNSPVETSFEANSPPPDAEDADGVMFDTASGVMFEHLKRSSLSAREQQAAPRPAATAVDRPG